MKKTYMIPAVQVVEVRMTEMLAASNQLENNGTSINLNSETMIEGDGEDAAARRQEWDIWVEEEEAGYYDEYYE